MAVASLWCLVLVALEGCWGRSTHGQSPHEQGLRSSPELPLPDLIESPLKKYDPGLQDLNATELHLILGKGFHPGFMSVSQPPAPPRGRKRNYWWKRRRRKGRPTDHPQSHRSYLHEANPNKSTLASVNRSRLPPWVTDHLTPEPPSTAARRRRGGRKRGGDGGPGGRGRRRKKDDGGGGSGRWRRRLRRLLLSITHCPVRWTWKDVGIRFWPRWVKEGRCGGRAPPGEDGEDGEEGGEGNEEVAGPPDGSPGKGRVLRKGKNHRRRNGGGLIPLPRRKNAVPVSMRREPGRRRGRVGAGERHGKRSGGRRRRPKKERPGAAAEDGAPGDGAGRASVRAVRARRGRRSWPGEDGSGDDGQEPTCSIPAGMVCRPARKRSITLLRWHCREWKDLIELPSGEGSGGKGSWASGGGAGEDNNGNLKCQWIKVEYPIVTECSCQCPK